MKITVALAAVALTAFSTLAQAIGPAPAPLAQRETLTIGFVKVGHLSPILNIEEELKKFNIDVKRAEFVRYADARTALLSNSVDVSAVGPGDLAIAASQGSRNLIGLTGVAGSAKNLVVRKGVTINDWKDIAGKKIGIAPGSAVWFQWAMTLVERGIPYNSFTPVNIQGGGTAFIQAIKRGDIDAMVLWEPFESQAVAEGDAVFAKNLEYSQSKAVTSNVSPEIRNLIALYTPLFTRADLATLRYTDPNVNAQIGGGKLGASAMAVPDTSPVPAAQQRDYFDSRGKSSAGIAGTAGIDTVGEAWQWLIDLQEEQNFIREGQRPSGEVPEQYSLRTNYTFRDSLRGFSLGGGVRWQAGAVLGALATRPDASGVQQSIVPLASRPTIRGDAVFLTDLNVGYQRKIMHGRVAWEIQCNVSNVFNNRERIPTTIYGDGLVRYYRWNEPLRITLNSSFGF